jgi:uncharacterized protein (TIGR02186 family)
MGWLGTRTRWLAAALLLLVGSLQASLGARADELVADLSQHLIAITTAFVGTNVVLFGTSDGDGDIVVTVHGPRENQVVRRKARVAGIWINRTRLGFADVPAYYAVAASGPLDAVAHPDVLARHEIGVEHLKLKPIDATGFEISEIAAFQDALVRNKQRQDLYSQTPAPVNFIGPRLFRTTLSFPANVAPGIYRVQVFELSDGQVTDAQRSNLVISKIGLEADIYDFAQQRSALYGLLAVALSLSLGWLAGVIFRKG